MMTEHRIRFLELCRKKLAGWLGDYGPRRSDDPDWQRSWSIRPRLSPCPFCGSSDLWIDQGPYSHPAGLNKTSLVRLYWVACCCGARGARRITREDARWDWERRSR